jgi:hypothetical protein
MDLSNISDDELQKIANQENNTQDLSSVSDEELNSIANQPIGFKGFNPSGAEVAGTALVGGGLATQAIGKAKIPSKLRNFTLAEISGYSRPTISITEREGYKAISAIDKKGVGQFAQDLMPDITNRLTDFIVNAKKTSSQMLEDLGLNPDDIESIRGVNPENANIIKSISNKSLTDKLNTLSKKKASYGKIIGKAENLAKEVGTIEYIPKTINTIKRELNNIGYLSGDAPNTTITNVKNKALQGLLSEWTNLPKDPNYQFNVNDIQRLRTNLEASLSGKAKFDRIIYKVLDTLGDEHINNLNMVPAIEKMDLPTVNKNYSDMIKLEDLSKKLHNITGDAPTFVERFRTTVMEPFKSNTRKLYKSILGDSIYRKLESAVAASEIFPVKEQRIGPFQTLYKEAIGKGLFRTMRGTANKIGEIGGKIGRKGANVLSIGTMALDALKYKDDPEAYMLSQQTGQDYWTIKQNLAPKGSQEREIQLGRIL